MSGGLGAIDTSSLAIPPSVVLSLIIAGLHGSLFFLLAATRGRQLVFYYGLAAIAGLVGQLIATVGQLPAFLSVGDCNVAAVMGACWIAFGVSRMLRLDGSAHTRV